MNGLYPHTHPRRQDETILDVPIPSASSTAVLRVQLLPQFPDHAPGEQAAGAGIIDGLGVIRTAFDPSRSTGQTNLPRFPHYATALRLLGIVIRHQWVDPGGLVAYHPRLNPWHSQNSLGE